MLAWTTTDFDFYAVFDPLADKVRRHEGFGGPPRVSRRLLSKSLLELAACMFMGSYMFRMLLIRGLPQRECGRECPILDAFSFGLAIWRPYISEWILI
jgi:hypothetical protein